MSVFISWSGKDTASYRIAVLLKEFIPKLIQKTDCFISSDMQAGTVWDDIIFKELEKRNIGLVCITRENLNSPWLNFEAGAIAKNVGVARMCPVLVDLPDSEVPPPLSSFQMKSLKKADVLAICEVINSNRGEQALSKEELNDAFEARWQEFENALPEALKDISTKKTKRRDRELLEEILARVRSLGVATLTTTLDSNWLEAAKQFVVASSFGSGKTHHRAALGSLLRATSPDEPVTPSNPAYLSLRVPEFKSALNPLDAEVWPMLEITGNHFRKDSWMFTFLPSQKDVFDALVSSGPKRDALKNASRASGLKIALICEREEVSFSPT
jgi:TIR domain